MMLLLDVECRQGVAPKGVTVSVVFFQLIVCGGFVTASWLWGLVVVVCHHKTLLVVEVCD